jgi:hypothetical protein
MKNNKTAKIKNKFMVGWSGFEKASNLKRV